MTYFTPAIDLATQLANVDGIGSASIDPAQVTPSGVWVQVGGITFDRLDMGYTLRTFLRLVVPDTGVDNAATALSELLAAVLSTVTPDGEITPAQVTLPHTATPLPGLTVPVHLYVDPYTPQE